MAGTCKYHCQACNCSCDASGAQHPYKCPQCNTCKPNDDHSKKD